ncbi:hypothetical protein KBC40_02110 [Patescibacteria group bacterium]|nr:hypothetical protein [Patescibacteria group bacterium]
MPILKKQKLFIYDHVNSRESSEIYLSEPKNAGQFFISIELAKDKVDYQHIVDKISSELSLYFDNSQNDDPESLLEEILQLLNQLLPTLAPQKNRLWFQKINLAVGILHSNSVYLAGIGNIDAWLLNHNQFTQILDKSADINPAKIFTDITSGSLDSGDVLIISTNALFDYVSKEKIRLLTQKYSPQAAVDQLYKILATVPDFVTFNSLFIKNPSSNEIELNPALADTHTMAKTMPSSTQSPQPELKQKTETSTHHTQTPHKKAPNVKTKLVFDKRGLQNIKFVRQVLWLWSLMTTFFAIVGKIFQTIFQYLKKAYLFLFSNKFRRQSENTILASTKQTIHKKTTWFSNLTWRKKILIVALLIVVLIFLQGLVFLTQKKAVVKQENTYQQGIDSINNTLNEVEASLIYEDEKRAEELLLNVQNMLNNLQAQSTEQAQEIADVKEQAARLINKIRHINYVDAPMELFDLSTLSGSKQIVQKDAKFYLLDQNSLYLLEDSAPVKLTDFANGQTLADWPGQSKLILSNNEQYSIFNLDNKQFESFDFNKASGNTQVQDLNIYSNNLYALDSQNNKIFKYPESGTSFSNGVNWLTAEADLSQAYSFAIDGDAYLTFQNGEIKKLRKGKFEKFDYHIPHPVIGQKSIIKTFKESKLLYLIDPDNQRVIIFDKEGNIKDQYTSPKFDNLVDLAIDPAEKAIYLLNGNHLYLLAINE